MFSDLIQLLKTFTFRKTGNLVLLALSYYLSKLFQKNLHWGKPFAFSVEPTTHCNLHCLECPSGQRLFSRPTGNMSQEVFQQFLNQVKHHCNYLTLYFQGEPYLNPHFFSFVKQAHKAKIYVATSTNAHFLTPEYAYKTVESGLNRIILSLDGTDAQSYEMYRKGGDFEKVMEGIRNLVFAKKKAGKTTPQIILQFIVFKHNQHQIPDIQKLAKKLGVDKLELKSPQIYRQEEITDLQSDITRYQRYRQMSDGSYTIRKPLKNNCWRMWNSCVITWDGDIVPCCFDKDADFKMGNILKTPFAELWNSDKYNDFRREILQNRSQIEICRNCTE